MRNQKLTSKASVLPRICSALASTLVISQAILHQSAHAADTQASAIALTHLGGNTSQYKVVSGDTLVNIAKRLTPPNTHPYQVAIAIFLKNPKAFKNNNLNKIKAGAQLLVPSLQEVNKVSLAIAKELIKASGIQYTQSLAKTTATNHQPVVNDAAVGADLSQIKPTPLFPPQTRNYTIQKSDTLLHIAKRFKIAEVHNYQLAVAIYLKNPNAFKDFSLNKLIVGADIIIPAQTKASNISLSLAKNLMLSTQKDKLKNLLLTTGVKQQLKKKTEKKKSDVASISNKIKHQIVLEKAQPTLDKTPEHKLERAETTTENPVPLNQISIATDTSILDDLPRLTDIKKTMEKFTYLVSPLEEELMAEVTAIKSSIDSLSKKIPTSAQQKKDQTRYLNTLQGLIDQLGQKIKSHDQQQLAYETQIKALLAEQEKLLQEQAFYQQTYNTLKPKVRHANFITPKNINHRERANPNHFFRSIATHNRWNKPLSPLLEKTEALYCAADSEQATSILENLFDISPKDKDWPDEWMGTKPKKAMLYAGTMDILLSTLYRNIYRFPELTELTERVALQWDYCPVTGNGGSFYNLLQIEDKALVLQKAAPVVPLRWSGFNQWGFMIPPPEEHTRYVPELLEVREPRYAFEIFLHKVYQQHCFPHPDTGKVYTETDEERVLTRVFHPPQPVEALQNYPYTWLPFCKIPEVEHRVQPAWPKHLLQRASYNVRSTQKKTEQLAQKISLLKKEKSEKQKPFQVASRKLEQAIGSVKVTEQERKKTIKSQLKKIENLKLLAKKTEREAHEKIETAQRLAAVERRRVEQEAAEKRRLQQQAEDKRLVELEIEKIRLNLEKQLAELEAKRQKKVTREAEIKRLAKLAAEKQQKAAAEKKRLSELAIKNKRNAALQTMRKRLSNTNKTTFATLEDPPNDFIPMAGANGDAPVINKKVKKSKKEKYNVTTTLIYTAPLSGAKHSGKLNVSWAPLANWFARSSLKYVDNEGFTYSWGIGYSNWRPGTTSVQLNNWGPIKPSEGLAMDKAVLSIGHKIDSEYLRDKKISTALGFSQPLSGDPGVSVTFQWSPVKNWYFRTTAAQKIKGGPTNWSYGFGHFDWRPETWRVEYSNYGKNRYPFDNFEQGAVTVNRAWQF